MDTRYTQGTLIGSVRFLPGRDIDEEGFSYRIATAISRLRERNNIHVESELVGSIAQRDLRCDLIYKQLDVQ
jgi:hypothetical protein